MLANVLLWLCLLSSAFAVSVEGTDGPLLQITTAGMVPPNVNEIALVFYVTVMNKDSSSMYNVSAEMVSCCLQPDAMDVQQDCASMTLLGDTVDELPVDQATNITLVFLTLYPFGRAGNCQVHISHDGSTSEISHSFAFNTTDQLQFWIADISGAFFGTRSCKSVDLDPFNMCKPVNCELKYGGVMNYYNVPRARCEPVVTCISDPNSTLPTHVYIVESNICEVLKEQLTLKDVKGINIADQNSPYDEYNHPTQYLCVHGQGKADGTIGCECDHGWVTANDSASTDNVHYMCNVQVAQYIESLQPKSSIVILSALGIACIVVSLALMALCFKNADKNSQQYRNRNEIPLRNLAKIERRSNVYGHARVHTPNMSLVDGELNLRIGDIITDLCRTNAVSIWRGNCNGITGTFPVACAEFFQDDHQSDSD